MSSTTSDREKPASSTESLFSRIIVTPLLFISFLISLFLIDKQTYSRVLSGHSQVDHYYHSHQRKMAKQELEDAFHMRNRVLGVIFVVGGVSLAMFGWGGSMAVRTAFPGVFA